MKFTYTPDRNLPFIPIVLTSETHSIEREALVDSGATNNVLPYSVGVDLGFSQEMQTYSLEPEALLRGSPVFGVRLYTQVKPYPPVEMVFAWTQRDDMPLILGHVNFFWNFDLFFSDARDYFEIVPAQKPRIEFWFSPS